MKKTASPAINAWSSEVVKSVLGKLLASKNCVSFAEGNSRNFAALATWRALKRLHDQHSVPKNALVFTDSIPLA
jgi:hypothetical protein